MIITMTAIIRPRIFERTMLSLKKYLVSKEEIKLILNIDPVGVDGTKKDILNIAKKYFKNIDCTMTKKPSFEAACINIWSKVDEDYMLHWEDDCELLIPIKLDKISKLMESYPVIVSFRFSDISLPSNLTEIYYSPSDYIDDGEFRFHVSSNSSKHFGTGPSFIQTNFIKEALPLLTLERNLEKQFRAGTKACDMKRLLTKSRIAWCVSETPVWRELGVVWRKKNNIKKINDGSPLRYK